MAREYAHVGTVGRELAPFDGVYTYRHIDRDAERIVLRIREHGTLIAGAVGVV